MSPHLPPSPAGVDFADLAHRVEGFAWRGGVEVERVSSPQRLAPDALALAADVVERGQELGNGRLVLLHDPHGNEAWQGTCRMVSFTRAEVGREMVSDPVLAEVGWSWLVEALGNHHAAHVAASGTVTTVASRCFGGLADQPDRAEVEVRASWTPVLGGAHDLDAHLAAWQDLLCTTAGLPVLPAGVVLLGTRQARTRTTKDGAR